MEASEQPWLMEKGSLLRKVYIRNTLSSDWQMTSLRCERRLAHGSQPFPNCDS